MSYLWNFSRIILEIGFIEDEAMWVGPKSRSTKIRESIVREGSCCARLRVMEEREEGEGGSSSYRYWVRGRKDDAVPVPEPRKLTGGEENRKGGEALGSVWNQAGTWEERSVNKWASQRLKDLILSVDPLRFSTGNARISDVSKCEGDVSHGVLITKSLDIRN